MAIEPIHDKWLGLRPKNLGYSDTPIQTYPIYGNFDSEMMIQRHGVLGCRCQTKPRIHRPPLYQKKIFPISGNQGFVNARNDEFGACLFLWDQDTD